MSSGKISLPHKCPKCGVVASNESELRELFGFRTMNQGESVRNQSWCKKCR